MRLVKVTSVSNLLFTRFVPTRLRGLHGPTERNLVATFRTPEAMVRVVPDAPVERFSPNPKITLGWRNVDQRETERPPVCS